MCVCCAVIDKWTNVLSASQEHSAGRKLAEAVRTARLLGKLSHFFPVSADWTRNRLKSIFLLHM